MKYRLKNLIHSLLLALFLSLAGSRCSDLSIDPLDNISSHDYEAAESLTFGLSALNIAKLQLEGINGNIIINGSSQTDSVIIICEKKVMSDSREDAEQHLSDVDVSVQNIDDTIFIKTIQPAEATLQSYAVDYLITLPVHFQIEIELINGSVQIDSVNNRIDITNINGNIKLNEIAGNTIVKTMNGNIIGKQTVPVNGVINHLVINGNIDLSIPENSSAEISATLTNGIIEIENLNPQIISISPQSYQGILGNGEGNIILETVNGTIRISGY